jgi:VanZ family protein
MSSAQKIWTYYAPPVLTYGLICFLSSLRTSQFPRSLAGIPDAVPHFGEFFLLAFLIRRIFTGRPGWRVVLSSFSIPMFLGFLDELHQHFVPTRTFSAMDLVYDLLGISTALLLFSLWSRRHSGRSTGRI